MRLTLLFVLEAQDTVLEFVATGSHHLAACPLAQGVLVVIPMRTRLTLIRSRPNRPNDLFDYAATRYSSPVVTIRHK